MTPRAGEINPEADDSEVKSRREGGFTYPVVLIAVLIMAIAVETAATFTSTLVRRELEEELLFRGVAYHQAIRSYYAAVPTRPQYPRTIADLLSDPRFPQRRHLRYPYPDPTGGEWRLITAADGRIMGVASASGRESLKRSGFPPEFSWFAGASRLSEWEFVHLP
jgi:type II secretory pathway pseudopilin PulG